MSTQRKPTFILEDVQCAFPDGVSEDDYPTLLAVLRGRISDTETAEIISEVCQKDYIKALEEVSHTEPYKDISTEPAISIHSKLMRCSAKRLPEQMAVIPDYLQDTYEMLVCAYPDAVPEEDYWALLSLLHAKMSFRTLARVLGKVSKKGYSLVLQDAMGFGLDPAPDAESVERVKRRLISCGYENWLESD